MAFEVREAGDSDLDEIGTILGKAYKEDPIMVQLMPGVAQEIQDEYWTSWLRREFPKPGEKMFTIVDTSNCKIAAFCKVHYPTKSAGDDKEDDDHKPPEGTNVELLKHWLGEMDKFKAIHMNAEEIYYVHVLGTAPEYQRKGIGTMLLNRFTDDADKAGAKTYLQATAVGAGLYPKLGWVDVERITINSPNGDIILRCMMREPKLAK